MVVSENLPNVNKNAKVNLIENTEAAVAEAIKTPVSAILAAINNRQVNYQFLPLEDGCRRFAISLNQDSLQNCPRPLIVQGKRDVVTVDALVKTDDDDEWEKAERAKFLFLYLPPSGGTKICTVFLGQSLPKIELKE